MKKINISTYLLFTVIFNVVMVLAGLCMGIDIIALMCMSLSLTIGTIVITYIKNKIGMYVNNSNVYYMYCATLICVGIIVLVVAKLME